jgi:hypothetical protein
MRIADTAPNIVLRPPAWSLANTVPDELPARSAVNKTMSMNYLQRLPSAVPTCAAAAAHHDSVGPVAVLDFAPGSGFKGAGFRVRVQGAGFRVLGSVNLNREPNLEP